MRDATAIAEAVRAGEVSAVELTREHLRLAAEDELGAVWLVTEQRALREAEQVDALVARGDDPGPLAGVPVGWKDLIDTGGTRTTYGSAIYRDHVPDRDADVVARLAAAGAICIAKLNTHELAWGTTCDNPWFGACRNPRDPTRVPGGSSGGSGAAVAAGIVALAPGTDTGGSIRCPASACGVVGLKPSFGRVSLAGIKPLCPTLDHCGPIARSVRDCALALEVMAGCSPHDPRTPAVVVERYRDALASGIAGKTVALAERFFFEHTDPELAVIVREAAAGLERAGARLVEIDLEWPVGGTDDSPLLPGRGPARCTSTGRPGAVSWGRTWCPTWSPPTGSGPRGRTAAVPAVAYQQRMLERIHQQDVDLILTPTEPCPPPPIGTHVAAVRRQGRGRRDQRHVRADRRLQRARLAGHLGALRQRLAGACRWAARSRAGRGASWTCWRRPRWSRRKPSFSLQPDPRP